MSDAIKPCVRPAAAFFWVGLLAQVILLALWPWWNGGGWHAVPEGAVIIATAVAWCLW